MDGVISRAIQNGRIKVRVTDLRDFTSDRHRTVDDRPFGGGEGMVFKPEPIYMAVNYLKKEPPDAKVFLLSPRGRLFDQELSRELAAYERIILICGRYEGVDERVMDICSAEEISIGDYILSGGEPAALVVMDAVSRLIPGVLGCERSSEEESFSENLLEYPHYTRPRSFAGKDVPSILLTGDHEKIRRWRRERALETTLKRRPELLSKSDLDADDIAFLREKGWTR